MALLNASANRDERHFPDADRFDIERSADRNLAFGYSAHFCLGAALARLEGRVVLDETLDRMPEWEVDESRRVRADHDGPRPRQGARSPSEPMNSSLGQYCLNVTDLDAAVAFYTALGLDCTSRTEIPQAFEAIVENPAGGSKLQLAQQKEPADPFDLGTAFWKLYVNTHDIAATWDGRGGAGATVDSTPERLDRWPVTVGFVRDPDGYLVELVERDPWPDGVRRARPGWASTASTSPTSRPRIAFCELLGLTCTSRTEIPHAHEAILEHPGVGGKLQLAQQADQDGPVRMGSMWKLYVNTDDCEGSFRAAVDAGHTPGARTHGARPLAGDHRLRRPTPTATRSSSCSAARARQA